MMFPPLPVIAFPLTVLCDMHSYLFERPRNDLSKCYQDNKLYNYSSTQASHTVAALDKPNMRRTHNYLSHRSTRPRQYSTPKSCEVCVFENGNSMVFALMALVACRRYTILEFYGMTGHFPAHLIPSQRLQLMITPLESVLIGG